MADKLGLNGQAENIAIEGATGSNIELKSSRLSIGIYSIDESYRTNIIEAIVTSQFASYSGLI